MKLLISYQKLKVVLLNLAGFASLAPCLLGMRAIALAARVRTATATEADLFDRFAKLRADLRWFLVSAGAIVAAAVISNGAFITAINQVNRAAILPAAEILLYGGFCSGALTLFYLPSYETFSEIGRGIIQRVLPASSDGVRAWSEISAQRSHLAEALGLHTTGLQALQEGTAILAPLIASGVTILLAGGNAA